MLKAVIFDFDGVIADSEPLHLKAFQIVLKKYFEAELSVEKYYQDYLGYTDYECIEAISKDLGLGLVRDEILKFVEIKTECFEDIVRKGDIFIAGVETFVDMLRKAGVKTAICSGALLCDIELMLNGSTLQDKFDFVVAADHVKKGKPDPEGYLMAYEKLKTMVPGIKVVDCVVIEDSHWGLEAASAAGMRTLAVANTYPKEELKADIVVDRLDCVNMETLKKMCI